MKVFLKAQSTSLIATSVDYTVTFILKKCFLLWFVSSSAIINITAASVIGTIMGGIVSFILGRNWAFSSKEEEIEGQALRFFIVWLGNLALNAGGMYSLTQLLGDKYWWISKIVVSLIIGIGYNYVLQKFFVFKKSNGQLAEA